MRTNSHLRRAWSKVTNTRFLTLLIAIGTLATAFVAYRTANDSHEQVQLLARQVAFNSSETRPFLRLKPNISAGKLIRVDLDVRSLGRIPARLIAYDMMIQVGHKVIPPKGGTFNTGDVLYTDQPGLGIFQMLTDEQEKPFIRGAEPIIASGCAIYGSITGDDTRRWKGSVAYRFDSARELPIGLFANEIEVTPGTDKCDASTLYAEWTSQLKIYPK
jgi:hypothetical protein